MERENTMKRLELIKDGETLDDLQINGYAVIQKEYGFRFGMDAILLANFAKVREKDSLVDLCSGTGIIPFVIAAKNKVNKIVGIEIQEDMAEMANRTALYNDISEKVKFINGDLKDKKLMKSLNKVDVVTVNPPYKLINSGLVNLDNKDSIARHEICCTLGDVIEAASTILKDKGRLYMVHRPERIADILCEMRKYKIEPKVIKMIQPSMNRPPNLVLIEGQKGGGKFLKWDNTLCVYNEKGEYTEDINIIYGKEDDKNE